MLSAVKDGTVVTTTGNLLSVSFDSVCLHGDNPEAVRLAAVIHNALQSSGIIMKAFAGAGHGG